MLETVADNQLQPRGIANDATTLYWTSEADNTILTMPIAGGAVMTLASDQHDPYLVAVDATRAYWTNAGDGTIMSVPLAGGTPVLVASSAGSGGLSLDDTYVYYHTSTKIMKVAKAGGAPSLELATASYPERIVVRGPWVYFTAAPLGVGPSVYRVPTTGGTPTLLGTSAGSIPMGLAVTSTSVFWADGDYVSMVPLAGGVPPVTIAEDFGAWRVTADETAVYWGGALTKIKKRPHGGVASTLVACASACPMEFAQDATMLYWTSYNASSVMKVSK